jgi:two-component system, NarL family, invasion response regulator UvrY
MLREVLPESRLAPIRIGIVDDYSVVRAGLERLFSRYADLSVVASAGDGREALELVLAHELDVLILDIAMPGESAVDVLERIVSSAPQVKVLIFSGYPEQQYALPMIRLGAHAYVDKASPLPDIVEAVRVVASGRTYFSANVHALMSEAAGKNAVADASPGLTAREFQIFLRLAAGETVTEIAAALSLSDVTISSHRSRLLQKLKLSTNSHLTRYAIENHYLG